MQENSGDPTAKADPAIYSKLRLFALNKELPAAPDGTILAVLMDGHVPNGTYTALAFWDGDASLYLSSGGGFIGGARQFPEIREAALMTIAVAVTSLAHFSATEVFDLPAPGDVRFFIRMKDGVKSATVAASHLQNGIHPLAVLSAAMQRIVTTYRLRFSKPQPAEKATVH